MSWRPPGQALEIIQLYPYELEALPADALVLWDWLQEHESENAVRVMRRGLQFSRTLPDYWLWRLAAGTQGIDVSAAEEAVRPSGWVGRLASITITAERAHDIGVGDTIRIAYGDEGEGTDYTVTGVAPDPWGGAVTLEVHPVDRHPSPAEVIAEMLRYAGLPAVRLDPSIAWGGDPVVEFDGEEITDHLTPFPGGGGGAGTPPKL